MPAPFTGYQFRLNLLLDRAAGGDIENYKYFQMVRAKFPALRSLSPGIECLFANSQWLQ
jgi:hypothetical protein